MGSNDLLSKIPYQFFLVAPPLCRRYRFRGYFFFLRRQERELNFPRFGRMGLGSRVYLIICPDLVGVQWQVARIYLRERRIKVRDINSVQRSVLLIHIIILDQGLRILVGSVMYRLGGHSYKFRLRLI